MPAISMMSLSLIRLSGGWAVRLASARRERLAFGSASISASSLWMCTFISGKFCFRSLSPATWSMCPCVSMTARGLRLLFWRKSRRGWGCRPGSMIIQSFACWELRRM